MDNIVISHCNYYFIAYFIHIFVLLFKNVLFYINSKSYYLKHFRFLKCFAFVFFLENYFLGR